MSHMRCMNFSSIRHTFQFSSSVVQDRIAFAAELLQIDVHESLLSVGRPLHGLFDQESVLLRGLFD